MPTTSNSKKSGDLLSDRSAQGILVSNVLAIGLALWQDWDLGPMMWIYWCQSVIIGGFNFRRMMKLQNFCTDGFTSNGRRVPEDASGRRSTAFFFLVHYGFFHLGYLAFIASLLAEFDTMDWLWTGIGTLGFLVSHSYSFRYNVERDLEGKPNLGTMMFLPYCRIVPMHLTICCGVLLAKSQLAVLFFMVLKSIADHVMHKVEHNMMRKSLK